MDAEQEQKINLALEQSAGNVSQAAKLLGVPRHQIVNALNRSATLAARWRPGEKPAAAAMQLHRPDHEEDAENDVDARELEIAAALEAEDALVRKGLDAMGFSHDATNLAVACQKFQSRHYRKTVEMLGGGINKVFFDVMLEIKKINEELDDETLEAGRETSLRIDRAGLLKTLKDFAELSNKGLLIQARVHMMMSGGKKKKEKPASYLNLAEK